MQEYCKINRQYICLVLSCNRPYYLKRRLDNYPTFKAIQAAGFQVIFLLGDANQDAHLESIEGTSFLNLVVPVEDIYDFHVKKMDAAYSFLANTECIGILKIDDDTKVNEFEYLNELKDLLEQQDYFGVLENTSCPGYHYVDAERFKTETMLKNAYFIDKQFKYFGGPFYYISKRVLNHIARCHLHIPFEDAAVGRVVDTMDPPAKRKFLPWFETKIVEWSYDTESTVTPNT